MRASPALVYLGLVGILVIALAYYKGFVQDTNAFAPYAIQFFELGQGRNPTTGNFSNYPQ